AAFAILLRQICAQEDIVIGGLVANRVKPAARSIIGPLVNTCALRFRFSEIASPRDAFAVTRSLVTMAYRHFALPFERIIEDLKRTQKLDPRFRLDAVFNYFTSPPATLNFNGVEATPLHVYSGRAQSGLILRIWPHAEGMSVFFEYQRAHFSAADI